MVRSVYQCQQPLFAVECKSFATTCLWSIGANSFQCLGYHTLRSKHGSQFAFTAAPFCLSSSWYDRLNLSEKPFVEIRRRWRNANCHLNIATPSEIFSMLLTPFFFWTKITRPPPVYIRDEHGDISIYSLLFSPSRRQLIATMKLVWLVLLALICDVVLPQASTTTLTYLIKTTTTTTSTHQVNALCASYVSVTGPCRRRKNIWLNDPQLIFAYDQELRRIFNPTQVHR